MAAALALFTSLAYGVSNFVGPTLSKDSPRFVVLIAGQALALIVSVAVVVGASQAVPDAKVWATAALAGIGNAWGLLAFYRAAEVGSLSIVTPVSSLAVLIPVTAGVIDGEPLGPAKIAGLVLALGGVALATRRKEPGRLPVLAIPGLLLFAGTISYAEATHRGDLSVVSVLGSLFPIVTIALAFAFGGERLSRIQGVGVAAAVAGVVLVSAR